MRPYIAPDAGPHYLFWSASIPTFASVEWEKAFERKYHRVPNVLVVHGGDDGRRWICWADDKSLRVPMASVVSVIHAVDPSRPLLVLSCNPGGYDLHTPDVFYSHSIIWNCPIGDWGGACGDINDFVRSK